MSTEPNETFQKVWTLALKCGHTITVVPASMSPSGEPAGFGFIDGCAGCARLLAEGETTS